MTKNSCQLINELYEEEIRKEIHESIETIQLTIQLGADYKFLLEGLSERFKVSQSAIARPLLEDALEAAFLTLTDKDKKSVSEYADKKTKDFLVKTYKERGGSYEHHGLGRWAGVAYCAQLNDQDQANKEEAA